MTSRRNLLRSLCLLLPALPGSRALAATEGWPQRSIRIVTSGAGSVPDLRARWLAERLAPMLGQAVLVDNVPAAGGNVAAQTVARAAPDGHTLLLLTQGLASINPHLYEKPGYEPLRDLQAVVRFGVGPLALVVPAGSPLRSVSDLAEAGRSREGGLNFGTPGVGTPQHLASEMLQQATGARGTHVPYNGFGRVMAALLGGSELDWALDGLMTSLPHIRAGRLRVLAVTGRQRSPVLPEVQTVAESGIGGFEYLGWTGLAAPAGTSAAIVDRLHGLVAQVAQSPETRQWFESAGSEPGVLGPSEFTRAIRAEHESFGALIRSRGLALSAKPA